MPQPRIPRFWRERIMALLAQTEQSMKRPSDKRVWSVLVKEAEGLKVDPSPQTRDLADRVPSERTISRIRKEEWPHLSAEKRAQYREFQWPESMERGDLPWEAAKAALLLSYTRQARFVGRPTIRQAKWFWRLSLAAPDLVLEEHLRATDLLAVWEAIGDRPGDHVRGIEWYLTYAPWRAGTEERAAGYEQVRQWTDEGAYEGMPLESVPPFPSLAETVPGPEDDPGPWWVMSRELNGLFRGIDEDEIEKLRPFDEDGKDEED